MAKSKRWQWIPTNLSLTQFEQFVLPHLIIGSRGPENPRGRKAIKRGRKQIFDDDIFEERFRTIERVFAWEDKLYSQPFSRIGVLCTSALPQNRAIGAKIISKSASQYPILAVLDFRSICTINFSRYPQPVVPRPAYWGPAEVRRGAVA